MMPSTIRINPEKTTMAQIVEDQPTITVGLMSFRMAIMMLPENRRLQKLRRERTICEAELQNSSSSKPQFDQFL